MTFGPRPGSPLNDSSSSSSSLCYKSIPSSATNSEDLEMRRLSNIIPNALLLKLKSMNLEQPRKSYHFTATTQTKSSSSSSSACNCRSLLPELQSFDRMLAWSSTSCNSCSNSPLDDDDDVVIGIDQLSLTLKPQLPPIKTEHKKFSDLVREIGGAVDHENPKRRRSPRVRIRPRLSKRVENSNNDAASAAGGRKSVSRRSLSRRKSSESMAVVKSSADPERDFRESMVEMIVENQIRAPEDLEELLACYLSLNSSEYHHLIIQAFKQVWFHMNHTT